MQFFRNASAKQTLHVAATNAPLLNGKRWQAHDGSSHVCREMYVYMACTPDGVHRETMAWTRRRRQQAQLVRCKRRLRRLKGEDGTDTCVHGIALTNKSTLHAGRPSKDALKVAAAGAARRNWLQCRPNSKPAKGPVRLVTGSKHSHQGSRLHANTTLAHRQTNAWTQ